MRVCHLFAFEVLYTQLIYQLCLMLNAPHSGMVIWQLLSHVKREMSHQLFEAALWSFGLS